MATWKELTGTAKERKQSVDPKKEQEANAWNDLRREALGRKVDDKYIQSYLSDSQKFFSQAQTDYSGLNWQTGTNKNNIDSRKQSATDLQLRNDNIRAYLNLNKDQIGEDSYNSMMEYLDSTNGKYGEVIGNFDKAYDYYSKFDNQDHYNAVTMSANDVYDKVKSGDGVAYTAADGTDVTWQALYNVKSIDELYNFWSSNPDWAEKSTGINSTLDMRSDKQIAYQLSLDSTKWWNEDGSMSDDAKHIVKKYATDQNPIFVYDENGKLDEMETKNNMNAIVSSLTNEGYENDTFDYFDHLADYDESGRTQAVFTYMYNTLGRDVAMNWYKGLEPTLEQIHHIDLNAYYESIGEDHPIAGSLLSVPMNVVSGLEGLYNAAEWVANGEMTWNKAHAIGGGFGDWVLSNDPILGKVASHNGWSFTNGVDWESLPNMSRSKFADYTNSIRGGATKDSGAVGKFAYDTLMSGVDSVVSNAAFGPAGAVVLGGAAAAQASNNAMDRGLSGGQAFNAGVAAGVNEGFWEGVSAGKLNAFKEAPVFTRGDVLREAGKLAATNALEEMATERANLTYDRIAFGDQSNYAQAVQDYIAQGYSEKDAREKANKDDLGQVLLAGASGALMGLGMGASGTISNVQEVNRSNQYESQRIADLTSQTLATKGGNAELADFAETVAATTDGKTKDTILNLANEVRNNPTEKNVSNLYKEIRNATSTQDTNSVAAELVEKGVSRKEAAKIARSIVQLNKNGAISASNVNLVASELAASDGAQKAVAEVLNDMVLNKDSGMNQRQAEMSNIGTKAMVVQMAEELEKQGVSAEMAEKIADVMVTAQSGGSLSAEAREVLQAVQENPKLAKAIQSATEAINMSAEDAFRDLGNRYSGGNQVIASMPKLQQDTFARIYDSKVNGTAVQFADAMAAAYALGYDNRAMNLEGVDGALLSTLTEAQRQFAWKEGRSVAASDAKSAQKTMDSVYKKAEKALKKSGRNAAVTGKATTKGISVNKMNAEQKASYDLAQQIAPAVKAEIVVYKGGKEWGFYDHKTDSTHLNANAKWNNHNMMVFALAHELVHRAKKGSPMQFKAFSDFLLEQYGNQGTDIDAMIGQQMAAADRFDQTAAEADKIRMTPEMALEEVICDAAQRMLLDTDAGKKLAQWGAQSQQNKGFLEKVKSIIQDILNRLRSALKGVDPDSLAAQEFGKMEANAKKILADMFVDMSIDAGEKLSTIKAAGMLDDLNKNTATEGGVKYKLDSYSQHQLENWKNSKNIIVYQSEEQLRQFVKDARAGRNLSKKMYFGAIPANLANLIKQKTGLDVEKYNCTLRASEVRKIFEDHGNIETEDPRGQRAIVEDDFVTIPQIVQDPDDIRLSDKQFEGKPVIEFIKTINGKTTIASYVSAKHLDLTVQTMYSGKNKGNLATAAGDQAPADTPEAHVGTVPTNNIRANLDIVKPKFNDVTETQQFKRWFGDWQKHPKNASKVVNSDGTPRIMYHGSPAQFAIFDKKKAKSSGQYGSGFYFTNSQSHAGTYGQQYSVYLNIRNPLESGRSNVSRDQVRKFLETVADNEDYSIENYGTYDVDAILDNIMGKNNRIDAFRLIQDVNATAIGDMVEATELFNKVNGTKFDGIIAATETVAFYPEQIKSATDNIGTFDGSNPDIRYKLPIDKTSNSAENSDTLKPLRGDQYDNRGVREGTAEASESGKYNGGTASGSSTNAQTVQSWENIPKEIQQKVKAVVSDHIAKSPNSDELFYFIISMVNETENTITAETYDRAVDLLTEALFNDAQSLHSVLFEGKWGIMGGSISDLRRSIITNVGSKQFKLPASEATNQRQAARDALSRYQEALRDQRDYKLPVTEGMSAREMLANVLEEVAQTDFEREKLQEYKAAIGSLNELEEHLHDLKAQIKEMSFAKGQRDKQKLLELRSEATKTENRINIMDKRLLRMEAAKPLQDVLDREKQRITKREKQKGREALKRYREKTTETREKRIAVEKLQKLVLDTAKWISYPAKTDVKCPDILKQPYADFLNGIDLSSKRLANGGDPTKNDLRLANAMGSLATALDKIMASQDPAQDTDKVLDTGYLDLPAKFVEQLRDMTEKIKDMMVDGDYVVNNMTAAEVKQLSQMIRTLNHAIKTMSNLYANLRFANIEALGADTMEFMDALGEIEKTGGIKDFVEWDNALPYYAFKRFGKGGESVFEGLMDAQDKLAFLAQEIFNFRDKAWTDKEAKAWSEDTHTITLPNGNELTLTTADAMSIYCLSRRDQGLQHLLGGGTRVLGIQKGSKKAKDSRSLLTIKDIDAINSSLTDRQKKVAEAIQEFMSTVCSDWGNEISMKRFLTKEFTENFYFPIESNDENLATKDPAAQQSDLFRLLNISATKPLTPGANNEVIIRNIFDVFTGHASDMARLNAYGMALLDYMKWLNYREKTTNDEGQVKVTGVRKSMNTAYGDAARSYVLNLIKDVNGRASDGGDPNILMKWMRAAKTASVGSSLRVATLQITSYPRAALVLSPKSLALGLTKLPNINRAKKYCGIALWKSFGFYDTNISRSIEDQMKGVTNVKQKLIELSLKGAEWGDAITWGALWNACEYEVAKTTKNKVGSEEFYQEVGKKLREVVYRTQVVDSTLTRSQLMRSKRGMAQEAAAFMSEPTLSANILMDAKLEFEMEKRRTGSAKAAWKKTGTYIGRSIAVYAIGQIVAALLEAMWDAWREDEDEEFKKKYWDAFLENLILDLAPFNKIPIVSDVFKAVLSMGGIGFFSSDKMATTWLTQAVSAVDAWKDALNEESSSTYYNAIYKSARAFSSYYGVSFSGAMREGVALWNNTAGAYDSTLKIRTWDLSNTDLGNELYEAIISGDTRQADSLKAEFENENAMHSAVRKALRENDPRIKEAAQAHIDGDPSERVRIQEQIEADGFDHSDVLAAVNSEINDMTPDKPSDDPKVKGYYTAEDFALEFASGDIEAANEAREDIIATAEKNGKTPEEAEKYFVSSAKKELKELYLVDGISKSDLVEALKTYCPDSDGALDDDEIYWLMDEWDHAKENGSADGYAKFDDFYTAVETGADLKKTIKVYTDNGVSEKTLKSNITSHFKPIYLDLPRSEQLKMRGYLINAFVACGDTREQAMKKIDNWE